MTHCKSLGLLALGAFALTAARAEAPLETGIRPLPPRITTAPTGPLMPTRYPNVFVLEAPGSAPPARPAFGPAQVYVVPGSSLAALPAPKVPSPLGTGAGLVLRYDTTPEGYQVAYLNPNAFPYTVATITPSGALETHCTPMPAPAPAGKAKP
jgi:hypothetical protein